MPRAGTGPDEQPPSVPGAESGPVGDEIQGRAPGTIPTVDRLVALKPAGIFIASSLAALLLLAVNLAPRLRFEDALITLRYARNIVQGHGFVFNPGERVLGVSSPLHTLLSTFYVWLGGEDAPFIQNVAGAVCLVLLAAVVVVLVRALGFPRLAPVVGVLTLCNLNLNYLYIGMEVHLFALLVLLAYLLYLGRLQLICGVVLGLAFLTRSDAALMAALIGVGFLVQERRLPLRLATGFLAPVLPWLVFAELYFGSVLPTALAAKKGYVSAAAYLEHVFWYYKATFKGLISLYTPVELLAAAGSYLFPILLAIGAWVVIRRDRRHLILVLYPLLHLVVYAAIGADPGFTWHYFVLNPLWLVLFAVAFWEGGRRLLRPLSARMLQQRQRLQRGLTTALLVVVAVPLLVHLWRGLDHRHAPDGLTRQLTDIAHWLKAHYDPQTSLLQPAIGILGWETGMRIIDHAGLVTPGLFFFDDDHCTPMAEVLERHRPDLVLFRADSPPDFSHSGYRPVREFGGHFTYYLFARDGTRDRPAPGRPAV